MTPYILLILGLILIFIEFYIPGAIMGIAGGLMVFASVIMFAMQTQSPWEIALYVIAVGVILGYLIKFAIWRIRTAKPDYSIYSDDSQNGFQASSFDAAAIGKHGVVITDLKPGGHILVEGKRLQAISQSGYLVKGTEVLVIGGQEESLIVKPIKKESTS